MTDQLPSLAVKPVIHYPREAQVGKTYLMTIDLQPEEGFEWQYEEEEYPIYCSVDSELFSSKPVGEPVVVLHRFGGSYGEAKFLLTPFLEEAEGKISVALVNRWGVPVKTLILSEIQVVQEKEEDIEFDGLLQDKNIADLLLPFAEKARNTVENRFQDWGDAPDVSFFGGRNAELSTLEQWITNEGCRLVALLGMGGIGKTALAVKLAERVQDQFEYIIWRSLRNATPIRAILMDFIKFLSNLQEADLSTNVEVGISRLIHYLRQHRCLLVLDNVDAILASGTSAGNYLDGYEGYGQLFKQISEISHQSCLLLTSRETPIEIARLEGKTRPMRSLVLNGLSVTDSKQIFAEIGDFQATETELQTLFQLYRGNPLALKLTARYVQEIFGDNVTAFLQDGTTLFQDLRKILYWHIERLSDSEKKLCIGWQLTGNHYQF